MQDETWIQIVAMIIGFLTLVVGQWRMKGTMNQVHTQTNSRLDKMLERQDQLENTIRRDGGIVPPQPTTGTSGIVHIVED